MNRVSLVILAGVAMMLLPLLVVVAMATHLAYDGWFHRKAERQEAAGAEALRQIAGRHLVVLEGGNREAHRAAHHARRRRSYRWLSSCPSAPHRTA